MKLLDTSVAVDHLRGYGPATVLLDELVRAHEPIVASELTRFELLAGTRPGEHDDLENFFSVLDWIPVTDDVARRAGEYARIYRRSHAGIGVVDYLLAGTVSTVGADLMTINVRQFPMFEDLRPPYEYGHQSSAEPGTPTEGSVSGQQPPKETGTRHGPQREPAGALAGSRTQTNQIDDLVNPPCRKPAPLGPRKSVTRPDRDGQVIDGRRILVAVRRYPRPSQGVHDGWVVR